MEYPLKLSRQEGKVLCRVILERLRTAVDDKLRDNQAGSVEKHAVRTRSTLRIIVEQSIEWNSLYVIFEKAFESLDRESL